MVWIIGACFIVLFGAGAVALGLSLPMYEYAIVGGILVVVGCIFLLSAPLASRRGKKREWLAWLRVASPSGRGRQDSIACCVPKLHRQCADILQLCKGRDRVADLKLWKLWRQQAATLHLIPRKLLTPKTPNS